MSPVDVILQLPEDLVNQAKAAGILTDERVTAWLQSELLRQRSITELRNDVRKLRALKPALTQNEIDAEVRAVRSENISE